MADEEAGENKRELPVQETVWPPPPAQAVPLPKREPLPSPVEAAVQKHLSIARRFLVFSILITPIFCLPFVFYHAVQANRKGGRGQGRLLLVVASVYLGLTALALTALLARG